MSRDTNSALSSMFLLSHSLVYHLNQSLCLSVKSRVMTNDGAHICLLYHFYLSHLFPRGGRLTLNSITCITYSWKESRLDRQFIPWPHALVQFLNIISPQTRLSSLSIKIILKGIKIVTNFERFQEQINASISISQSKNIKIRLKYTINSIHFEFGLIV